MLAALAFLGFISNVWLYVDDMKNRGAILDLVSKTEGGVTELMAQPVVAPPASSGPGDLASAEMELQPNPDQSQSMQDSQAFLGKSSVAPDSIRASYITDQDAQDVLKRSMARPR